MARYMGVLLVPATALLALLAGGVWAFAGPVVAFLVLPVVDALLPPDRRNLSAEQEAALAGSRRHLWFARAMLPVQLVLLGLLLWRLQAGGLAWWEALGLSLSMGVSCGVLGINVAHELGHRASPVDHAVARALLVTSLYDHFFVEHNRGHHRNVATEADPASARRGQTVMGFIPRSVVGGFRSAWKLERARLSSRGLPAWQHTVAWGVAVEVALVAAVAVLLGPAPALGWVVAAAGGVMLLETVNYVEHYGLRRRVRADGRAERVQPRHSWNSDHVVSRAVLFELSRHADHHAWAARPYQVLRSHPDAPQLPLGYPGMIVLAWFPPAWFAVMHPRLDALDQVPSPASAWDGTDAAGAA